MKTISEYFRYAIHTEPWIGGGRLFTHMNNNKNEQINTEKINTNNTSL